MVNVVSMTNAYLFRRVLALEAIFLTLLIVQTAAPSLRSVPIELTASDIPAHVDNAVTVLPQCTSNMMIVSVVLISGYALTAWGAIVAVSVAPGSESLPGCTDLASVVERERCTVRFQ